MLIERDVETDVTPVKTAVLIVLAVMAAVLIVVVPVMTALLIVAVPWQVIPPEICGALIIPPVEEVTTPISAALDMIACASKVAVLIVGTDIVAVEMVQADSTVVDIVPVEITQALKKEVVTVAVLMVATDIVAVLIFATESVDVLRLAVDRVGALTKIALQIVTPPTQVTPVELSVTTALCALS